MGENKKEVKARKKAFRKAKHRAIHWPFSSEEHSGN